MSSIEAKDVNEGIKAILIRMLKFIEMKITKNPKTFAYVASWEEIKEEKKKHLKNDA